MATDPSFGRELGADELEQVTGGSWPWDWFSGGSGNFNWDTPPSDSGRALCGGDGILGKDGDCWYPSLLGGAQPPTDW
jgi:hypothetical protein